MGGNVQRALCVGWEVTGIKVIGGDAWFMWMIWCSGRVQIQPQLKNNRVGQGRRRLCTQNNLQ